MQADFLLLDANLTIAEAMKKVELTAGFLSHFIIRRQKGGQVYHYLFPQNAMYETYDRFQQNLNVNLEDAFNLHEYTSTATISESIVNTAGSGLYVVLSRIGEVTGYLLDDGKKGVYPESPAKEDDTGLESFKPTEEPAEAGAEPEHEATTFKAFPFISDPGDVKPAAKFSFEVGFSRELDATLKNVQGINIANPDPDAFIEVAVMAIGAEIDNNVTRKLPLDVDAKITFHATAHDNATSISLMAVFLYKRQPVGTATRVINEMAPSPGFNFGLPTDTSNAAVDFTAIIRWDNQSGQLRWKIIGANVDASEDKQVADTREFAASLSRQLDPNVNSGMAAFNILTTLGQDIAALIPQAFFTALKQHFTQTSKPPRVLILTDEPYIPWELAYHQDLILHPTYEPFLHLQTIVGRWWMSNQVVMPPPTSLPINRLSVVATDYSNNPGVSELLEAANEKRFLVSEYKALEVSPELNSLLTLTGAKPTTAGHMLHVALHGTSNAASNEQEIILEDGKPLNANAMIGPYFQGQTPAISFMFLNACQVGTAGTTLGKASGFPGIMLKKGMLGFIAPLWSIDDVPARLFSEQFYKKALGDGRSIGEVLLELRRSVDYSKSITELAYLYYGHPGLTLKKNY